MGTTIGVCRPSTSYANKFSTVFTLISSTLTDDPTYVWVLECTRVARLTDNVAGFRCVR